MLPLTNFQMPLENGKFGAIRKHDIHTGIDLYCSANAEVKAIESGIVTQITPFTGPIANLPWWNNTHAVVIKGASGYILYGEVAPLVELGQMIEAEQVIAKVLTVLKKDKGLPTTMLHLELYSENIEPVIWNHGEKCPKGLLDPSFLIGVCNDTK